MANTATKYSIPENIVFNFLYTIFILAFIVSPYWVVPENVTEQLGLLTLFAIGGFIWSKIAAHTINFTIRQPNFLISIGFFLFFLGLNKIPLSNPISYLGDEIHHFTKPLMLNNIIGSKIILIGFLLGVLLVGFLIRHLPRSLIFLNIVLIVGASVFFIFFFNEDIRAVFLQYLVRYPFFPTLIHAIPPAIGAVLGFQNSELLYRVVPFLSSFGVIWLIAFHVFSDFDNIKKLMIGITLATIPIVFYYSSILYLEMPIVFLLVVVLINSKKLLSIDEEKWQNPGWFALLLLGFIKETILPLIAAFIAIQTIYFFVQKKPLLKIVKEQAKSVFCLFFPMFLYLVFRGEVRGYRPDFSGLFSIEIYQLFFQSMFFQFGITILLFIAGLIYSFKKELWTWILSAALCGAILLFYAIDSGGIFIGYSRFNLFFIPLILLGFYNFILKVNETKFIYPILLTTIAINLFMSPINIDGSRNVDWENCMDCKNMSVDMVYPYHPAFEWFSENCDSKENELTIIKQREYYYPYKEYYRKTYNLKSNLTINSYKEKGLNQNVIEWMNRSKKKKSSLLIQAHRKEELNSIIEKFKQAKIPFELFENNALSILIAYE